jgi:hypothetical protein
MHALIMVDREFKPWSGKKKKIGICCLSPKHATFKEKEPN